MVFMRDSERAAELAISRKIDVGLHVNFSEEFSGSDVSATTRDVHRRIARFLRRGKYALLLYHPLLRASFREAYHAQIAEFRRLYGGPPSHVDGHLHLHLCTNLLFDQVFPAGQRVRRSFSFQSGEKSLVNRTYRWMVDWRLSRRYRLTDYFFALSQFLHPAHMIRISNLAKASTVELMTHPIYQAEYAALLSENYLQAIHSLPLASFAQL
jgi:predicted glycoside hydrolase/deacetylase ChbG (UPF0249 family)